MGASASVRSVYRDATVWFRKYFDDSIYVSDFMSIDKNQDGSVSYKEFAAWLQKKAIGENGPWRFFVNNPEIVEVAHLQSSKEAKNSVDGKRILDVNDFRSLLIQLFAVSIIWTHFKKADESQALDHGTNAFDGKLSPAEFILAVHSFCNAYGQEKLSEECILEDFQDLDTDKSGMLSLSEVCSLCAHFVTADISGKGAGSDGLGLDTDLAVANAEAEAALSPNTLNLHTQDFNNDELVFGKDKMDFETFRNKSTKYAMNTILDEVGKNQAIAEMTEMRMTTEMMLDTGGGLEGLE